MYQTTERRLWSLANRSMPREVSKKNARTATNLAVHTARTEIRERLTHGLIDCKRAANRAVTTEFNGQQIRAPLGG